MDGTLPYMLVGTRQKIGGVNASRARIGALLLGAFLLVLVPANQALPAAPVPSYVEPVTVTHIYMLDICSTICMAATLSSSFPSNFTAIVIASFQNSIGQTVYITTDTVDFSGIGNLTAYTYMGALPRDQLCVNAFVISLAGGSMSPPTSFCFQL